MIRQLVLVMAMAGAGSALFGSPAAASVDSAGNMSAGIYNLTPYTWTLVAAVAPTDPIIPGSYGNCGVPPGPTCWYAAPPATIAPGAGAVYKLGPRSREVGSSTFNYYGAYFTYRVDVVGGPAEYVTVTWSQCTCSGLNGTSGIVATYYNTTAPPPSTFDPGAYVCYIPYTSACIQSFQNAPPWGGSTANPQITFALSVPFSDDFTFSVNGNWTVDAQSPLGVGFDDALNTICNGPTSNPNCTFTQIGPITWGAGAPTPSGQSINCNTPAPNANPTSYSVAYSGEQETSLSVGGGVTASTEADILGIVGVKASVDIEAQREWSTINTFTRTAQVYLMPHQTGSIWTSPEVAVVKGTLVLKSGSASFTVTNFYQTRSGVTKNNDTPAYDSITQIRPSSAGELAKFCHTSRAARAAAAGARPALIPGRGVAGVKLGQPRDSQRLRRPLIKSPRANRSAIANDCRVLDPWCTMVAGHGGTWVYPDLSVVFGADRRVSALFYSGRGRSAEGVGVGSSWQAVRAAYPRATCETRMNCSLKSTYRSKAVKTVFHFITKNGRRTCDRVLVYFADERRGKVGA